VTYDHLVPCFSLKDNWAKERFFFTINSNLYIIYNRLISEHFVFFSCDIRKVWRYQRQVIRIRMSKKNRQHNGQKIPKE